MMSILNMNSIIKEKNMSTTLSTFFHPKTVAVIGASINTKKPGNIILRNLLQSSQIEKVIPVNPFEQSIEQIACIASVLASNQPIDVAIIAVPADQVNDRVKECVQSHIPFVIVITSGFSELGTEFGNTLEKNLKEQISLSSTRLLGPNTLGYYVSNFSVDATFLDKSVFHRPKKGPIAFLSQSGSLAVDFMEELSARSVGLSAFVGLGNKTDLSEEEFINYFTSDDNTQVVSLYLEGFSHGERFFSLCKEASKQKPVVVLKGGKSKKGSKAVGLHTGKIAGDYEVIGDVLSQAGVVEAEDETALIDYSIAFALSKKPSGGKLAIVTNGGGNGIVAVDLIEQGWETVLSIGHFSDDLLKELTTVLPDFISPGNPIDLTPQATNHDYVTAVKQIASSNQVDVILIGITSTVSVSAEIAKHLAFIQNNYDCSILVYLKGKTIWDRLHQPLSTHGIACFPNVRRAVNSAGTLVKWSQKESYPWGVC